MNDGPESFQESLAKDVLAATRSKIEAKVMSLTCPIHGEKPKWKSVQTTGTQADLQFSCCCQTLAGMLQKALA
jgi:hypothetical protein